MTSASLPYDEGTFDYVFSSMMFHHLKLEEKEKTLREVRRVLKLDAVLRCLISKGRRPLWAGFWASLFRLTHLFDR